MTGPALPRILIICGPTASGKSELAVRLAQELDGEIVNADSMQIHRAMDIGTAKPTREEMGTIPHHLLDVADPDRPFSAADFSDAASQAISGIIRRGRRPIVVGGTGLYLRALLRGLVDSPSGAGELRRQLQDEARELGNQAMLERLRLVDPQLAATIHPNNLVRIIRGLEVYHLTGVPLSRYQHEHGFATERYRSLAIGIRVERRELYERIERRVDRMLATGLLDEVRALLEAGFGPELKAMRSIGYRESCEFLAGSSSLEETTALIKRNTRRYAKRQLTWFNADPEIIWLEYPEKFATILRHCIAFFE
jgi:tRNA dimethylallyltransferase